MKCVLCGRLMAVCFPCDFVCVLWAVMCFEVSGVMFVLGNVVSSVTCVVTVWVLRVCSM